MSPDQHSILYNHSLTQTECIGYVNHLSTHVAVEEFVEAELRPSNILADYTTWGLLINGKFFLISINFCGTYAGQYIEQSTASQAELFAIYAAVDDQHRKHYLCLIITKLITNVK